MFLPNAVYCCLVLRRITILFLVTSRTTCALGGNSKPEITKSTHCFLYREKTPEKQCLVIHLSFLQTFFKFNMFFFVGFPDKFSRRRPQKIHTLFHEIFLDFREKSKKKFHSYSFQFLEKIQKTMCVFFVVSSWRIYQGIQQKKHIQFEKLLQK